LIEKLESTVRSHAEIELRRLSTKPRVATDKPTVSNDRQEKYKSTSHAIGTCLLEFLLDKGLVTVVNEDGVRHTGPVLVKSKRGRYYKPMPLLDLFSQFTSYQAKPPNGM
jgi:hypothetical protein